MKLAWKTRLLSVLALSSTVIQAQYILNGSATQNSCNCYTLTQAQNGQSGSVWNSNKIDLNNPFDFIFNVFLGCKDADGADGIVFILQPVSTSIGSAGGGMGFNGIIPSVGIALDTWQNIEINDPSYDHISIQVNGNTNHNADITPLQQASVVNPNIEDCQWHTLRINWDPLNKLLKTYFDGNFRQQVNIDIIATVFNNDPHVYWGFSSATGGANNLQQFCTAVNPGFNISVAGDAACTGNAVTFTNTSESFAPIAEFFWDFGDNTTSISANPLPHIYSTPGQYIVKLAITGLDGCHSDTLKKTVVVGDYPIANFNIYDTCSGKSPRIEDKSQVVFGTITEKDWVLDGNPVSTLLMSPFANLPVGPHQLELMVKSSNGCPSAIVSRSFIIKPVPKITIQANDGCFNKPINFSGIQTDNNTTISQWNWQFGDGGTSQQQNSSHTFQSYNDSTALTAICDNGCISDIVKTKIFLNQIRVDANTSDTMALKGEPFRLRANTAYITSPSGSVTYNWSPAAGLDNPLSDAPQGTLRDDQTYIITVATPEGCVAKDTVHVTVFKGSSVYVPTGFTPNDDGRNDVLRPIYSGIKNLAYFNVYNRWGQLIFSTKNMSTGWDAMLKGSRQSAGVYIWIIRATDYAGKSYQLKGTTTLIR